MLGFDLIGPETFGTDIPPFSELVDWTDDLTKFFPLELNNKLENDYFHRHLNSFLSNQNLNNDYAILALHQLFMFCAYGFVYAVIKDKPNILRYAFTLAPLRDKQERQQLENIDSLFTLSLFNESTFFEAFSLAGASTDNNIKPLKELVKARNMAAHCNGATVIDFSGDIYNYIKGFEIMNEKFMVPFSEILLKANKFDYKASKDMQNEELKNLFSNHYMSRDMLIRVYPIAQANGLQKNATKLINNYISTLD